MYTSSFQGAEPFTKCQTGLWLRKFSGEGLSNVGQFSLSFGEERERLQRLIGMVMCHF